VLNQGSRDFLAGAETWFMLGTSASPGDTLFAARRRLLQRQLCALHWMVAINIDWSELE